MATKRRRSGENEERGKEEPVYFESEMPATALFEIDENEAKSAPEKELARCIVRPGAVVFDPFASTVNTKSIEDQIDVVEEKFATGEIDVDQALTALENVYTVNHSVGRNILYDRRLKPKNRALRYAAYALAHGIHKTKEEAMEYAVQVMAGQHKIAGNWGTVAENINILKQKEA